MEADTVSEKFDIKFILALLIDQEECIASKPPLTFIRRRSLNVIFIPWYKMSRKLSIKCPNNHERVRLYKTYQNIFLRVGPLFFIEVEKRLKTKSE